MFQLSRLLIKSIRIPQTRQLLVFPMQALQSSFKSFSTSKDNQSDKTNKESNEEIISAVRNPAVSHIVQDPSKAQASEENIVNIFESAKDLPPLKKEQAGPMSVVLFYAGQDQHKVRKNFKKAIQYYSDCLFMMEKYNIDDQIDPSILNSLIGYMYLELDQLDKAEEYLNKAEAMNKSVKADYLAPQALLMQKYYQALLHEKKGDLKKCVALLQEAAPGVKENELDPEFVSSFLETLKKYEGKKL